MKHEWVIQDICISQNNAIFVYKVILKTLKKDLCGLAHVLIGIIYYRWKLIMESNI